MTLHARVVEALELAAHQQHEDAGEGCQCSGCVRAAKYRALAAELQDKAIVPKEPNKAMRDAGGWVVNDCRQTDPKTNGNDVAALAYRAMLQAGESE